MKFSLPSFSLRHPVTVLMVLVSIVGVGLIACFRMPVKFLPEMDFPFIRCFIPYPGATPEQVENEVAIPAEGEFRTIPGVRRINTISNSDGCSVNLRFEDSVNMSTASAEVRDRMERLKLRLPKEVDKLFLARHSINSLPIMAVGLFRGGDEAEFIHLVRTVVEPRLKRLDGVAEVRVFASRPEPEVLIEFDQNLLRTHNIALYQVITSLQTANLNLAVGDLSEGETKYFVRVAGEMKRPEDLANIIVSPAGLRLKDIAKVGFRTREMEGHYDIDSKGGGFVLIMKESEANTVQTCHGVRDELENIKKESVFAGTESLVFFDQADLIEYALNGLKEAGLGGAFMAIIVLYAFLLRLRPTLVVTLAIPTSLISSVAFMFFAGMTLNVITMVSLIVAVGMLVDDAIVVIENIYRHHQNGEDLVVSSEKGASEVVIAVTASTLTIMVVFIPVLYMQSGEMAVHMKQFAVPMCAALFASLFVAFTLIPLATSRMKDTSLLDVLRRWRQRNKSAERQGWFARAFNVHPFTWVIRAYAISLDWALKRRTLVVMGLILLLVGTVALPYQKVGMQSMPTLDMRQIDIDVELEQNFDLAMTTNTFDMLKKTVDELRDQLGIKNVFTHYSTSMGTITIYLKKDEDYPAGEFPPYKTKEALAFLQERIPKRMPGRQIKISMPETGREEGQKASMVSVRLRGDDSRMLENLANSFSKVMAGVPNISDVKVNRDQLKQEVQLAIDTPLASNAGISPMIVARTVDVALRGNRMPPLKQRGREFPVWAQFQEEDRKSRSNLDNVSVFSGLGGLVPLNQLVTYDKAFSPTSIERVDGRNVITVSGRVSTNILSIVLKDLEGVVNSFELPTGYTIDLGYEFDELRHNMANFFATLMFAVVLVYIVMAALFESLVLPLSILVSIPLAFVGVYWGMFFMRTPLDTIGLIGCILMVGVVVRNGIVIVDHINFLRLEGMPRHDAVVQAGHDRFRPVVMTALTTILGVVPLAFEARAGSTVSFVSLGRSFISGLTTGTILTLAIVPLFYTLIEDMKDYFFTALIRFLQIIRSGKQSADTSPTEISPAETP
ncbi:MAG TPA: efflux RND transporter permease subunit [Candidatus Hydrogenedentes bacterium]|nr:efflux RND transporter permease subunit [Candidatus Hydrogenedentota bacterium]